MIEGLEGIFGDPNGPAYQKRETRVGPPLEYVQEKLGRSLQKLHALSRSLASADEATRLHSEHAFHYGLVAYLALINMLALANDADLADRLLTYNRSEFDDWLRRIEAGGSVTG